MKKFKFYALAFAAILFAGCSDNVIDGKGGNTGTVGDGTPAYLTISFSANSGSSSRSTADDANNNGDKDGNAEDSGHSNAGQDYERTVKDVLVVITPANGGNVNYARLYTIPVSEDPATPVGPIGPDSDGNYQVTNDPDGKQHYANNEPIELTTGEYNVIVVANPVDELISSIEESGDLNSGISNDNAVENLYNLITTGIYAPDENAFQGIASPSSTDNFRIMMANKTLENVTLDAEDTPENPATVTVDVERAYSKITFRGNTTDTGTENIYKVDVPVGEVQARLVDAAITKTELSKTATEETTEETDVNDKYEYRQLNVAMDAAGHEVYVLWEVEDENDETPEFKGVFGDTEEDVDGLQVDENTTKDNVIVYKKLTPITDANSYVEGTNYVITTANDPTSGLTYVSDEVAPRKEWYVKLEGYALVNLSKNLYYVRHTTDNLGQSPFGTLNGINYLYTPYWNEKNDDANIIENNGIPVFKEENKRPISEKWFYNTLAEVSDESKALTIDATTGAFKVNEAKAQFYRPMPTGDDQGFVNGSGDKQHTSSTLPTVGKFMSYCFENSTDIDHQMHGISTGISFVARIYSEADCGADDVIQRLYRYSGHLFESLKAIQNSFGADRMSKKFNVLVAKEQIDDNTGKSNITKEDLLNLAAYKVDDKEDAPDENTIGVNRNGEQIDMYDSGICYYYTTEIKHFDNGDNAALGNMEFAIMRNNIYSLSVTDINMIGDPFVDPTPNIPDEYPDNKTALNVEVKIVPWIVRYNDIQF